MRTLSGPRPLLCPRRTDMSDPILLRRDRLSGRPPRDLLQRPSPIR
jgi:hypothetical protein